MKMQNSKFRKLIYISHIRFPSEKTHSAFAMKTCEEFAKRGFDVELWIPWRSNKFRDEDPYLFHKIQRNFQIKYLPAFDGIMLGIRSGFFILVSTFSLSILVYALFRGVVRSAIFYVHYPFDVLPLAVLRPSIFMEVHELPDFYKKKGTVICWLLPRICGFITTNRYKAEFLQDRLGVVKERILIQQNAVDFSKFNTDIPRDEARKLLQLPQDKFMLLYTGHLFDWKGADVLFDSHKFLGPGEVIYFVGGTDADIQKFKIQISKFKIQNVVMVGMRPHEEIPWWLRSADVLILPHSAKFDIAKYETSPVKLFEYMASGRPVVAAALPSLREVVDDNMVWFFEPDNPKELMESSRLAISHTKESEQRTKRARAEALLYTWDKRSENIINFLNSKIKYQNAK